MSPTSDPLIRLTSQSSDALLLGHEFAPRPGLGFNPGAPASSAHSALIAQAGEGSLVTFGKTGSGKNRNALTPNLLTYPGSCVVLDVKGELYPVTAAARRRLGQQVHLLDPFRMLTNDPARLNPFDGFAAMNDVDATAQSLVQLFSAGTSLKEPFWDTSALGLLAGCISAVVTTKPPAEQNFRALANLFLSDDPNYNLAVTMDTCGNQMTSMARHEIGAYLGLAEQTRSGVFATAASYLKAFNSANVISVLCDSTINLAELVNDSPPFTIYLVIPPTHLRSHFPLVKLWLHTLLQAFTTRRAIPLRPTVFFLDEIAQCGHFPLLENIITLGRGYGLKCWLFFQNLHQIQANYPESWATILGNCDVMQIFSANDYLTARQLSEITGLEATGLLKLTSCEQYLVIKGMPRKARKLDYLRDALFAGRFAPNLYYTRLNQSHPNPATGR